MDETDFTPSPHRVQLRRTKGWRMPENTVKVDRTTRWGNPFAPPYVYPELAVPLFRDLMSGYFNPAQLQHLSDTDFSAVSAAKEAWKRRGRSLSDLRGKNLACWCKPGSPCHADVLLKLANPSPARLQEERV